MSAAALREIAVKFSSGREVLAAYWGFLSNGGLVIEDQEGLREGEQVTVEVTIESSRQVHRLQGQVIRRRPGQAAPAASAVIAFAPGEPHDLLLSAAWAEAHDVPARRHPRYDAGVHVEIVQRSRGVSLRAEMVNVSMGGCCVRRAPDQQDPLVATEPLVIAAQWGEVPASVRWARGLELGVEFDTAAAEPGAIEQMVERARR